MDATQGVPDVRAVAGGHDGGEAPVAIALPAAWSVGVGDGMKAPDHPDGGLGGVRLDAHGGEVERAEGVVVVGLGDGEAVSRER